MRFKTILFLLVAFISSTYAVNISKDECVKKGDKFIFAGGECIETAVYKGESEGLLNIIVHGTWDEGTNTLGRYAPFAENIAFQSDITTVAVALPGYSGSSTNKFKSLGSKEVENLAARQEYIDFLADLIEKLKERYNAESITYIGHSAGGMMGATLTGVKPGLINNIVIAGGRFDIHKVSNNRELISIVDFMDNLDKDTKYVLVYGTKDIISTPDVTLDFYDIAKTKGLDVTLVKVDGAQHLDLDMSDPSVSAILKLNE